MPMLHVKTNVTLSKDESSDIRKTLAAAVAKELDKPETQVLVSLQGEVPMTFGGTECPFCFAELISMTGLNKDKNKQLSATIAAVLDTKLSIPKNRVAIKFFVADPAFLGFNGTTPA